MSTNNVVEKVEEKLSHVPKKVWIIGGIALLLLFLYVRKRNIIAQQTSAASDGMTAAMSLPTGIAYAPISSGATGGGSAVGPDISSVFGNSGNAPSTDGFIAGYVPPTNSSYSATVSNLPTQNDGLNITADVNVRGGTGVFLKDGREITVGDIGAYLKDHTLNTIDGLTEFYNYGHSIGLNNIDIANLRSYAREDFGVNPYYGRGVTLTDSKAMPSGLTAGVVNSTVSSMPGVVAAQNQYSSGGAAMSSVTRQVSDSEILGFLSGNHTQAEITAAQAQYGVSNDRLYALTHPASSASSSGGSKLGGLLSGFDWTTANKSSGDAGGSSSGANSGPSGGSNSGGGFGGGGMSA